jgi:hypothetical protein
MARTSAGGIQEIEIQNSTHTFAADAGGSDDYAISLTPAVTAYVTGQRFAFKANTANTGAATLNVNGLGAKTIVKHSSATLASNDIKAGSIVEVLYDGTNFQMVSMLSQAPAGSGDMQAATYDALGIAGQIAGKNYANSFTKSQAILPDSDAISLAVRRNGAAQTSKILEIQSQVNATLASFDKDGKLATPEVTIDASGNLNFGAVTVIDDNAGTTTLQNIDAIDATTEATIEAAIDTLANLTSASSLSITKSQVSDLGTVGNVSKVGTPANDQVGVWTGDGTIEGTAALTFDGGLSLTVADAANKDGVTITQNDTTNSKAGIKVVSAVVPSAQGSYPLIVENTNAGIDGAFIQTYHNSASPAANDFIGGWDMYGNDSAGNPTQYVNINGVVTDPTNGSEDSQIAFGVTKAGTLAAAIYLRGDAVYPGTDDAVSLGLTTRQYSDLFLAEGGVINWDNGDATITQTNNVVKLDGADLELSGNIELGAATDTTLSRSAAGVLAVEGVVIPSISSTNTLTNKRVTKRTGTTTSSATPTINTDNVDFYSITAQTEAITSFTTNLTGTPTEGQTLWIAITGTGARAITWGTSFEASTVALPTTTVSTNRLDVGFVWNTVTSKWRCIASA